MDKIRIYCRVVKKKNSLCCESVQSVPKMAGVVAAQFLRSSDGNSCIFNGSNIRFSDFNRLSLILLLVEG